MERLLKIRKKLKTKKPDFIRQDAHKKAKIGYKWRKPKGSDSKMRRRLKGYRKIVTKGYKSPADVRGLSMHGLKMIMAYNVENLEKINKATECIIIAAGVGLKNKFEIVKAAKEKGINIMNVKNPSKFIEDVEKSLVKKKEDKSEQQKEKEKKEKEKLDASRKKEEKEKKGKEKETETDKTLDELTESDEKKKEEEKKDKDKVLIKKTN